MTWTEPFSGVQFDLLNPKPESINVLDIAWALSNQCRFAGHVDRFYSVAQHTLLVAANVPQEFHAVALLHDAGETWTGDITAPVKKALRALDGSPVSGLDWIETQIWCAIRERFAHLDLPPLIPSEVHLADRRALVTERRDLRTDSGLDWGTDGVEPFANRIEPMEQWEVYEQLLNAFHKAGIR